MNPLDIPNMIIPNHILKKTSKMQDLAKARIMIARKVDIAPWNTLEPIEHKAILTLCTLYSEGDKLSLTLAV